MTAKFDIEYYIADNWQQTTIFWNVK